MDESGDTKLVKIPSAYLGEFNGINIFLVDGSVVKVGLFMDFTEGNNSRASPQFIPPNQIWLEWRFASHELPFILYHELVEVAHMKKGMNSSTRLTQLLTITNAK